MKFSEFISEAASPMMQDLVQLLRKHGWTITVSDVDSAFTARFIGNPEVVLQRLMQATAFLELKDMTFSGRDQGTAVWSTPKVQGERERFHAEVRFWSFDRKPCAQINFYRS